MIVRCVVVKVIKAVKGYDRGNGNSCDSDALRQEQVKKLFNGTGWHHQLSRSGIRRRRRRDKIILRSAVKR